MKGFKRVGLFGLLCILSVSVTRSYLTTNLKTSVVEDDIVSRYQQEVLNNARYNNYKDSRKKYLEREVNNLQDRINGYYDRINDLNYEIDFCKNKRTKLDEQLAKLMCLDDLGDSTAQSRISILQKDISLNEDEIRNYEYQKNSYVSEKNDLDRKLRNTQGELESL